MPEEAMVEAYKLLYKKWTWLAKLNEKLTGQVVEFDVDRNNVQKIVFDLKKKLKQSKDKDVELNVELENAEIDKDAKLWFI